MRRSVLWLSCLGVALILFGFGLLSNYADANPVPVIDHYKTYEVFGGPTFAGNVLLEDQFGETVHTFLILEKFSTPVMKNQEQIFDSIAHLSWWVIDDIQPTRKVGVGDQFGWNEWTIKDGRYLLTPALKNDPAGTLPMKDHYKCYEVIQGPSINIMVTLEDQFDSVMVTVVKARYFCNPVQKTDPGGQVYPVIDTLNHLAVYEVQNTTPYSIPVFIQDQFFEGNITLHENLFLAVPAFKEYPVAIEESTWGRIKALYGSEEE
jgi:hypothetical protein